MAKPVRSDYKISLDPIPPASSFGEASSDTDLRTLGKCVKNQPKIDMKKPLKHHFSGFDFSILPLVCEGFRKFTWFTATSSARMMKHQTRYFWKILKEIDFDQFCTNRDETKFILLVESQAFRWYIICPGSVTSTRLKLFLCDIIC